MFLSHGYVNSEDSVSSNSLLFRGRFLASYGVEYFCSITMKSSENIEVNSYDMSAELYKGEKIICNIEHIGIVSGFIREKTAFGFVVDVKMSAMRHARIDARLDWLRTRTDDTPEQRRNQRITPINTSVLVKIGQTGEFRGEIIDLSMSGAAIIMTNRPEIGSVVTVGKRFATVIRHTSNGFAVHFRLPFTNETYNENLVL